MKTLTIENNRYPKSRKHFLLNLIVSLWFEKEKEVVLKTGSAKRVSQWKRLDPFKMRVEPPVIFNGNEMLICLVDRPAGVLLADRKIPLINFDTFLEKAYASDKADPNGNFNTDLAEKIANGVSTTDLYEAIHQPDALSQDPIFYVTKIENENDYIVIYDNRDAEPDFDTMISWVFKDYDFEEIYMEHYDMEDDEVKALSPVLEDVSSFYTGKVTVSDKALIEKTLTFNFIDLKLLAEVVKNINSVVIIDIEDVGVTTVDDTTTRDISVGNNAVITTSDKTTEDKIVLDSVKNDLGEDITEASNLVLSMLSDTTFSSSLKLTDFPYGFCFLNEKGYRRYVDAVIKMAGDDEHKVPVNYPITYALSDNYYTPTVVSFEGTGDSYEGNAVYQLGVKFDKPDTLIPHQLGENFALFSDTDNLKFIGPNVSVKDNVFYFTVTLAKYGEVKLNFSDPAVKSTTLSNIVNPDVKITFKRKTLVYAEGVLTATYSLTISPFQVIEFSESDIIDKNGLALNGVLPTVKEFDRWNLILAWKIDDLSVKKDIASLISAGRNGVPVNFSDTIDYSGADKRKVRSIVFGSDPIVVKNKGAMSTYEFGNKTLVTLNEGATSSNLYGTVTAYTTASGYGFTDSDQYYINIDNVNMTNNVYPAYFNTRGIVWPLSFNNDNGSGSLKLTIQMLGETLKIECPYTLVWPDNSITPEIKTITKNTDYYRLELLFYYDNNGKEATVNNVAKQDLTGYALLDTSAPDAAEYVQDSFTFNSYSEVYSVRSYINVKLNGYGTHSLTFKDKHITPIKLSVPDPNAKYTFKLKSAVLSDDREYTLVSLGLYKDNEPYSIYSGTVTKNTLNMSGNVDGSSVTGVYNHWEYEGLDQAVLVTRIYIGDKTGVFDYTLEGSANIGNIPVEGRFYISGQMEITDPNKTE